MKMRGWFATPAHNPGKLLAGPYETRAEAMTQCVILTSEITKETAAQALTLNVTAYYVPRYVTVEVHTAEVPVQAAPVLTPKSDAQANLFHVPKHASPHRSMYIKLTNKMIHFTREQLVITAEILEVEITAKDTRLQILNAIMEALRE